MLIKSFMNNPKNMKNPLISLKSIDSSKDAKYKPMGIIFTKVCKKTGKILNIVNNLTSTLLSGFLLFFTDVFPPGTLVLTLGLAALFCVPAGGVVFAPAGGVWEDAARSVLFWYFWCIFCWNCHIYYKQIFYCNSN